jgi:hypothetical protein
MWRLLYPSSVTLREGNLHKPYQSINTSYLIRKTWWLYLLLEKNLAIASYTKALFVQKWQMFSESDRRGIQRYHNHLPNLYWVGGRRVRSRSVLEALTLLWLKHKGF